MQRCTALPSRKSAVECNIVVVRKAEAHPQLPAAGPQCTPRDVMIDCDAQQVGKLCRFLQDRAEYSRDVRGAIETQAQRCRRRKHPVGGIEDHAAGGKRDPVLGRDFRRNMRFHVDGSRPGIIVKLPLFPRALHHFIGPRDVRVYGARQHFKQSLRPGPVGGENTCAAGHAGRHDPIAGNEAGRQASGNSEADDPGRAARDGRVERGTQSRALIANNRYAWTARDTRFKRQAGYGDDARLFRHPHPASRRLYPKGGRHGQRHDVRKNQATSGDSANVWG